MTMVLAVQRCQNDMSKALEVTQLTERRLNCIVRDVRYCMEGEITRTDVSSAFSCQK